MFKKCDWQYRVHEHFNKIQLNKPTCGGSQIFVDIAPHLTTISKTPLAAIVSTFSWRFETHNGKTYTKETNNCTKEQGESSELVMN